MFEFDAAKLILIGIVALIVIGPKELPRVLRQVGQAVAKLRHMAAEFQNQFMDAMREADLADIKEQAEKLAESTRIDTAFNPLSEIKKELSQAVDLADPRHKAETGPPAPPEPPAQADSRQIQPLPEKSALPEPEETHAIRDRA
jgi:sec-independent protein translocase protein TatB